MEASIETSIQSQIMLVTYLYVLEVVEESAMVEGYIFFFFFSIKTVNTAVCRTSTSPMTVAIGEDR